MVNFMALLPPLYCSPPHSVDELRYQAAKFGPVKDVYLPRVRLEAARGFKSQASAQHQQTRTSHGSAWG